MPIEVICESCGKRYFAPDQMAGKRIKCRQCQSVIFVPETVPPEEGDDPLRQFAALQEENFGHDSTLVGGAQVNLPPPEEEPQIAPGPMRYRARFNYPYAVVVDRWLPILLLAGGALWVAVTAFHTDDNPSPGLATARFLIQLLMYLVLIFPMGLAGVKMAARDLKFSLPRTSSWRALATFMPIFTLGAVLWMVSGGHIGGLILGLLSGFIVSAATMWLLFHLQPAELPAAVGYAGAMTGLAVAIAAGILIGLNAILANAMTGLHKADALAGSPFGEGFSWPQPAAKPALIAKKPQTPPQKSPLQPGPLSIAPTVTPTPGATTEPASVAQTQPAPMVNVPELNPSAPSTSAPPSSGSSPEAVASSDNGSKLFPGAVDNSTDARNMSIAPKPATEPSTAIPDDMIIKSPLVVSATLAPIDAAYDQIVRPLTPSAWAVLLHRNSNETVIDRVWVGPGPAPEESGSWKADGSFTRPADNKVIEQYGLSPNGDLLAAVSSFPIYSVVVRSYREKRIVQTLKLADPSMQADVIGFATDDKLLVHRVKDAHDGIELWDVKNGKMTRAFEVTRMSPDQPPVLNPDGTLLALAGRDTSRSGDQVMTIFLYDLNFPMTPRKVVVPDLNATGDTTTTGLCFNADGSKITALFEQGGNGLLSTFAIGAQSKLIHSQPLLPVPSKPQTFTGSSVIWLGDDALLLYGRSVMNATSGAQVGDLGLLGVSSQLFRKPDTCQLNISSSALHGVAVLKLNMPALSKATAVLK